MAYNDCAKVVSLKFWLRKALNAIEPQIKELVKTRLIILIIDPDPGFCQREVSSGNCLVNGIILCLIVKKKR